VDPQSVLFDRELYPQAGLNNAPLIRMAFQTTPGVSVGTGLAIGFVRINARITVRGRRVTPLNADAKLAMMNDKEREEMTRAV
jgi:hypothetical protein